MDNNFFDKILELGIGMSMMKPMSEMISQSMQGIQGTHAQNTPPAPPQIPAETLYYLVIDNAQAGPFNEEALTKIIRNNLIKPETLVWKSGMAKWMPASSVPEVNKIFLLSKI